ncbi:MAG: hypothetical protein IMY71_13595 [Bacteroidetes bacterium]|nr:hypothetical protein [Bacteroidota bacterium]
MDINRKNYEPFFMDYLNGRMSPDQVIELMSFLDENPDLKIELKDFEEINVEPGKIRFESKRSLKKAFIVNDSNFDDLCIASLEGDLTKEEATLFQNWLQQNPLKTRGFELYKKTRLIPEKITFDFKSTLKKSPVVRIFTPEFWGYFSAAASIIILMTLYIFISRPGANEGPVISENMADTTNTGTKSQTSPEYQTKTEIEKEIIPYDKTGDSKQHEIKPRSNNIVEKPVIAQDVNIGSDKSNRLIQHDTIELTLNKIQRKEINALHEKSILAALVPIKDLEVVENTHEYLTLSQMAVKTFKSEILKEEKNNINPDKFTLWDIADAGIMGINKIIGWEMEFDKEYNNNGEIIAFAFYSNTISFNHTMNK